MSRTSFLSALILGVVFASVLPAIPADKPTLPFEVRVAAKADLSPKNFTETLPGGQVSFEMVYVRTLLREMSGNVTRAAERAGVSRRFLQRLVARLGIKAQDVGARPEDLEGDDGPP